MAVWAGLDRGGSDPTSLDVVVWFCGDGEWDFRTDRDHDRIPLGTTYAFDTVRGCWTGGGGSRRLATVSCGCAANPALTPELAADRVMTLAARNEKLALLCVHGSGWGGRLALAFAEHAFRRGLALSYVGLADAAYRPDDALFPPLPPVGLPPNTPKFEAPSFDCPIKENYFQVPGNRSRLSPPWGSSRHKPLDWTSAMPDHEIHGEVAGFRQISMAGFKREWDDVRKHRDCVKRAGDLIWARIGAVLAGRP